MMNKENMEWQGVSWHCPNCGTKVTAYQNKEGKFKVQCQVCKCALIRTPKGRRRDSIEVIAPRGQIRSASI